MALWRAFQHDAFAVAKAAAFSAILTLFPAILCWRRYSLFRTRPSRSCASSAMRSGRILPEGTHSAVLQYFTGNKPVRLQLLLDSSSSPCGPVRAS